MSVTACVSNAHAPFLGAHLLLGDLVCRGVETISLPAYRRESESRCEALPAAERVYEVRIAAHATPSIRSTASPRLTLDAARACARETEARLGATHRVSIYNTATRQAVA